MERVAIIGLDFLFLFITRVEWIWIGMEWVFGNGKIICSLDCMCNGMAMEEYAKTRLASMENRQEWNSEWKGLDGNGQIPSLICL